MRRPEPNLTSHQAAIINQATPPTPTTPATTATSPQVATISIKQSTMMQIEKRSRCLAMNARSIPKRAPVASRREKKEVEARLKWATRAEEVEKSGPGVIILAVEESREKAEELKEFKIPGALLLISIDSNSSTELVTAEPPTAAQWSLRDALGPGIFSLSLLSALSAFCASLRSLRFLNGLDVSLFAGLGVASSGRRNSGTAAFGRARNGSESAKSTDETSRESDILLRVVEVTSCGKQARRTSCVSSGYVIATNYKLGVPKSQVQDRCSNPTLCTKKSPKFPGCDHNLAASPPSDHATSLALPLPPTNTAIRLSTSSFGKQRYRFGSPVGSNSLTRSSLPVRSSGSNRNPTCRSQRNGCEANRICCIPW